MSQTLTVSAEQSASDYSESGAQRGTLARRLAGIAATIVAELLVIALLLTLGWNISQGEDDAAQVVTFEARNISDDPPAAAQQPAQASAQPPAEPSPKPPEPQDTPPPELPPPLPLTPSPLSLPVPNPAPRLQPSPTTPPQPPKAPAGPPAQAYGPPDSGPPGGQFDSQRVGTAPNGEPMYAARWYREPTRQELAGYLSTATGPASALIVCKTVPDFYVEDCELLGESPRGSQMGRAVLAAAWQFRVRPAIVGGRSQVGSWVRIRIDYTRTIAR